ncbi:unnamed protein product [Camellia sinensis]
MIRWFLKLSQIPEVTEVPSFSGEALSYLQGLIDGFTISDALEVKNIEKVTNHDVKAVEYFLKQKCQSHPEIAKVLEFFHFVCTSEDINNLAHALMLKEALNTVIFPVMDEVIKAVCDMAKANAHVPMFSRTHGQRDLTDSTVLRNMGEGLGQKVNEASLFEDLNESWEVLAEPIQTVLLTQLGTLELLQKTWKRCGIILLLVKSGANLGRNRGKVRFSHDAENRPYLSRVEPEMVVGWYHSHPGFGCWLSGVDINTQQALIHGLNRHYYSIAINYRKNELEEKMLLNLHKKKWTDGLTLQRFDTHSKTNEQTVQKMQKQMSVMVTVLVTKEGKRLETALGRSMEKAVKANTDALWAHFQEENAKQEKLVRERTQQITSLITNCINKDLPAMVEKTVKKELAAVGPAVARAISPAIEKTISTAITEAFQRGVGDKAVNQLEKSVNSKLEATVARQIQAQFQTSGKQALQTGHEVYQTPFKEGTKEAQVSDCNLQLPNMAEDDFSVMKNWVSRNYYPASHALDNGVESGSVTMEGKKRGFEKLDQKQVVHRKSIDTFGQRTSQYRGVTRHRWTGRYEAHLWDNSCKKEGQSRKGRQVYLGGYDMEAKAARAYDLAALKYWGPSTHINFPLENYQQELEHMKNMTRQEYVAHLRRKSSGFSRGASMYRGVTRHHQHGRWQARIGRVTRRVFLLCYKMPQKNFKS